MTSLARILAVILVVQRLRNGKRRVQAEPRASGRGWEGSRPIAETVTGEVPAQTAGGPGPDSPLELDAPDWKQTIKRTAKEIKADRATLVAAGMAFYWFLAIFPAVIAAIGILGLVKVDYDGLIEAIRSTLPGGAGQILVQAVSSAKNQATGASLYAAIIGVAVALWSASSGMVALQAGLNVAYDVPEDRKFVSKRLVGLMLVAIAGLLGGVPTPFFTGDAWYLKLIAWALTVVAVVTMFAVFYYLGPKRESPRWHWVTPGGVAGAVMWIVVTGAFGWYASSSLASYNETYGSLAGVIVLIFWLYLTALTVLIGGELNAEVERQAEMKK